MYLIKNNISYIVSISIIKYTMNISIWNLYDPSMYMSRTWFTTSARLGSFCRSEMTSDKPWPMHKMKHCERIGRTYGKKRRWWIVSLENKQWITKYVMWKLEIQKKWKHKFYVRKDFGTTCAKRWQIDRKTELVLSRSWGSNRGVELRYPCHMTWDIGTTKCNSDSNMGLNMGDPLKMACFIGKIHD